MRAGSTEGCWARNVSALRVSSTCSRQITRPNSPSLSLREREPTEFVGQVLDRSPNLLSAGAFRLAEAELAPARIGLLDVGVVRPDRRREACAAVVRVGIVVEVHGGVDQHPVPLA